MLINPTRAILPSFVIAVGLAVALLALATRLRPSSGETDAATSEQPNRLGSFALSLAVGIACFIGVNLLRDTFSRPEKYWETLGLISVVAGLCGPLLSIASLRWRLIAWPLLSAAAAWFLVPTWETLQPGRAIYIPLLAAYLSCVGMLYGFGARSASPKELLFALSTTTFAVAAATAAIASLKYGELALIVSANLAAVFSLSLFVRLECWELSGMIPCAATLICGVAFVGYIYPQPPIFELMLLPFAPVGLFVARRISNAENLRGTVVRLGGFLVSLLAVLVLLFLNYGFE